MNPEDAEEYTKGLGQIVAGVWRQMDEGARLGVPQALGLSMTEWVQTRLGGSATGIPERPDSVAEPAPPNESATDGKSRRKALPIGRFRDADGNSATSSDKPGSAPNVARIRFRRVSRDWLVIPVCGVLGIFGGALWAAAAPPVYESQAAAFVSMSALPTGDPNSNDPFGGSQFALQRVQSYAQLATSPQVLQGAMHDLRRGDATEAAQNVKVATSGGVMLWVTVKDRDPQSAAHVADAVMANLVRSVATLEAGGGQHSPIQLVPVQPAIVPVAPAGSGGFVKSLLGLVAGLVLGAAARYFIRSRRDGNRHRAAPKSANPGPGTKPDRADDDSSRVVMLRVGDGRDFSRRVGR